MGAGAGAPGLRAALLTLLLLAGGPGSIRAQSEPQGLYLGLALRCHQRADGLVSPLRYSGSTWGPILRYDLPGSGQIRRLEIDLGFPRLTSSETGGGAHVQEGYRGGLGASVFHRVIGRRESAFALHLGGELRVEAAYFDQWYAREEKESWGSLFGLVQPGWRWSWRPPGGGEISQEVTVPLAGFVMRPDHQGMTEPPSPVFAGIGKVKGLHHSIRYLRPRGGRVRWGVSYEYLALRYPDPRLVVWTRHSLSLSALAWDWGGGPAG